MGVRVPPGADRAAACHPVVIGRCDDGEAFHFRNKAQGVKHVVCRACQRVYWCAYYHRDKAGTRQAEARQQRAVSIAQSGTSTPVLGNAFMRGLRRARDDTSRVRSRARKEGRRRQHPGGQRGVVATGPRRDRQVRCSVRTLSPAQDRAATRGVPFRNVTRGHRRQGSFPRVGRDLLRELRMG
jgi:hypothetical protein